MVYAYIFNEMRDKINNSFKIRIISEKSFNAKRIVENVMSRPEENLEIQEQNAITSKSQTDFKDLTTSICNVLEKDDQLEALTNKQNKYYEYNIFFKKKEKCSLDVMYIDGETQHIQLTTDELKEKEHEMEKMIEDAFVKLKELEKNKYAAREQNIQKHNAFKIAAKYYKTNFNFYVRVEEKENMLYTTLCYFTEKFDDTYSFIISKNDSENKWTLNSIKPELEECKFFALQERFHKTNNLSALTCTVWKIFMLCKNSRK